MTIQSLAQREMAAELRFDPSCDVGALQYDACARQPFHAAEAPLQSLEELDEAPVQKASSRKQQRLTGAAFAPAKPRSHRTLDIRDTKQEQAQCKTGTNSMKRKIPREKTGQAHRWPASIQACDNRLFRAFDAQTAGRRQASPQQHTQSNFECALEHAQHHRHYRTLEHRSRDSRTGR